jgi:protocatechuate 3,4-dioxygenase beta subunit
MITSTQSWSRAPVTMARVALAAFALAGAMLLLGGQPVAAATTVNLPNAPQTSNCGGGQVTWHFVINQIDSGTTLQAFSATFTNAGTITTFTSDANPAVIHVFVTTPTDDTLTAATATLSTQSGTPRMVLSDFRCVPTVLKDGSKFHDLNANGIWDVGEPGLANWTIRALQGGNVVATTLTDANGYYYFLLTPGTYTFEEVCPANSGWRQSVPGPTTTAANCGANKITETLVLGQPSHDNNFGNFQNATKSGYKFHDLNANGAWDGNEPALAGWTIKAFQNNVEVASTTTDANGAYSFSLTPGSYSIREVCPANSGWRQSYPGPITTAANCGANTHEITLTSGQVDENNNFGNFRNATKSGYKFHDLNANSAWDAGEPALAGWTIKAFQNNVEVASTTTDANGAYSFSLTPGSYSIREVCPANSGWRQSYPGPITTAANCGANTHEITLTSGQVDENNNFGNFQNATKSGYKFHDLNRNGVWDAGEPALSGWEIHLFGSGADGAIHLTATTNASGQYSFSVAPGSYTVCEILKTDWTQTYPNAGTPGSTDCSGHTHSGTVVPGAWGWAITLTSGQVDDNNHFGNHFRFEGCTPGYWKVPQHHDSWIPTGYATTDSLTSVFGANALNGSLLDGLNFGGGSGVVGAKQILLRAAVAALLNASHPDVNYSLTKQEVINQVTTALNSGNRGTMLALASQLDTYNNLGCPLN